MSEFWMGFWFGAIIVALPALRVMSEAAEREHRRIAEAVAEAMRKR